jgi:hypothetical protein
MRTEAGSNFAPYQASRESIGAVPVATPRRRRSLLAAVLLPLTLAGLLGTALVLPASASLDKSKGPKVEPVGTTYAMPDPKGVVVDVELVRVVTNATPKGKKFTGLHGKGPVIALEFGLKNISSGTADLSLFSTVLYYKSSVVSLTRSLGATSLGKSLKLGGTLAAGAQRVGWITVQGEKSSLQRIQSTLNGTNTGSWKS